MTKKLPGIRGLADIKAEAPPATAAAAQDAPTPPAPRARQERQRPTSARGRAAATHAERDRADEQLSVILPAYVVRQVKGRATEERRTLREVVLRALAAAGFEVDAGDMVDRRAEAARQRAELARIGRETLAARQRQ